MRSSIFHVNGNVAAMLRQRCRGKRDEFSDMIAWPGVV